MTIFHVSGQPVGKARARTVNNHGYTHSYTPAKTKAYEAKVRAAYIDAGGKIAQDVPLGVRITAYFAIPKSYSKKKQEACRNGEIKPTGKPDLDNVAKLVMDALNGVAFKDDSRVCHLFMDKRYETTLCEPGLNIHIFTLEEMSDASDD